MNSRFFLALGVLTFGLQALADSQCFNMNGQDFKTSTQLLDTGKVDHPAWNYSNAWNRPVGTEEQEKARAEKLKQDQLLAPEPLVSFSINKEAYVSTAYICEAVDSYTKVKTSWKLLLQLPKNESVCPGLRVMTSRDGKSSSIWREKDSEFFKLGVSQESEADHLISSYVDGTNLVVQEVSAVNPIDRMFSLSDDKYEPTRKPLSINFETMEVEANRIRYTYVSGANHSRHNSFVDCRRQRSYQK